MDVLEVEESKKVPRRMIIEDRGIIVKVILEGKISELEVINSYLPNFTKRMYEKSAGETLVFL